MKQFDVWFAIPSASVERCRRVLPVWRKQGYKIAILQNQERGEIPADIVQWSDSYPGWSESINILSTRIVPRSADIVVSGGCDMLPDPNHTAQELARQFFERFPDGFGVMQPHGDSYGNAKHYCGSPFLGRTWIDCMYQGNGPMHGGYRHNWGDVELYWLSTCMGALWARPDLTHFHEHFNRDGQGEKPAWWVMNVERHDRHDVELFIKRSWMRFPGHEAKGYARTIDMAPFFADTVRLAEVHHASLYGGFGNTRAEDKMAEALVKLAKRGVSPIALYGAGSHTKRAGSVLMDPGLEIACVIDDSAQRQGKKLWGIPIVSPAQALAMGVKAVVISSDEHEGAIWDNCGVFADLGIEVVRLYDPSPAEKNRRVAQALKTLAQRGKRRVALFGAGEHTTALDRKNWPGECEVKWVIDDGKHGEVIGLPIVSLEEARSKGIDAIVLSSNRHEATMRERASALRGVEVVSLYDRPPAAAKRAA